MKHQDDKLTLQETEQLCRLYIDCNLSVLEETELRYFLTQVDYHSPLIDDARRLMDIDSYISGKSFDIAHTSNKIKHRKWPIFTGIAASFAIMISIGLSLRQLSSHSVDSESYYIAYVDGHRLSDDAARSQIEAKRNSADEFLKEMSELEARNNEMIDKFFNP